jgi:hypothetical protein
MCFRIRCRAPIYDPAGHPVKPTKYGADLPEAEFVALVGSCDEVKSCLPSSKGASAHVLLIERVRMVMNVPAVKGWADFVPQNPVLVDRPRRANR